MASWHFFSLAGVKLPCQCILEIGKKDKSADSPNPESKLFVLEDWKAKWVDPSNSLMFEIKK